MATPLNFCKGHVTVSKLVTETFDKTCGEHVSRLRVDFGLSFHALSISAQRYSFAVEF